LRRLLILVNGHRFQVEGPRPDEVPVIDVQRAMKPGDRNTIVLRGSGPSGGSADVMIWDGSSTFASPPPPPPGTEAHNRGKLNAGAEQGTEPEEELLDWLGET
jgi:hypothetical protein